MFYMAYGFTVLFVVYGLIIWSREKKTSVNQRIALALQGQVEIQTNSAKALVKETERLSFSKRIIEPIWKRLEQLFKRNMTNEKRDKIEIMLIRAGSPRGWTPAQYKVFQLMMTFSVPVLFFFYANLLESSAELKLMLVFVGLFVGQYIPKYYLKQKTNARNKKAVKELPDFLDLLTVSIEAGLGFDSALSKVVSKNDGVLSQEFQRCLEEIRLGKTRREALSGVRERLIVDDINSLIGSIIQAETLGIGMAKNLNVQAADLRVKRKQRAEEQAMKAPIKMLIPLVLFVFPCIFIVLLGPVVISLLNGF